MIDYHNFALDELFAALFASMSLSCDKEYKKTLTCKANDCHPEKYESKSFSFTRVKYLFFHSIYNFNSVNHQGKMLFKIQQMNVYPNLIVNILCNKN